MTGKVVLPSLAPHFQLDNTHVVVEHLIFNVTEFPLDQLLVAEHVVQLGWNGVAEVENASTSAANCKHDDASQSLLTDAAPKPWLYFRG